MQKSFTIVVSHFVKEGKEKAFEDALKKVIGKATGYDGYEGIQIIRPGNGAKNEYILIIRFDTEADYKGWTSSVPRNEWFEELKGYVYKESQIRYEEGIEFWFSMPQVNVSVPPKKWKMAILTWMVVYSSVLTLSTLAGVYLQDVPLFIRMLLVSMILVSLMTYVIMPKITSVFAKWIFERE